MNTKGNGPWIVAIFVVLGIIAFLACIALLIFALAVGPF